MSGVFEQIAKLAARGEVKISEHGYDELSADGIFVRDVIEGLEQAEILEEYPHFHKGPAVLVLELDSEHRPFHVVWGIPKGEETPPFL